MKEIKCLKRENKNLPKNAIRIMADLYRANRKLPINQIAKRTNVSWKTAKDNIQRLEKRGLVDCNRTIKRIYCKLSEEAKKICKE